MSATLTMVVPTANRPKLAAAAVRSLLRHRGDDLRVFVSDTSSDAGSAAWLERRCRRMGDARLSYVRAPELPVGEHWDWAVAQALERTGSTHVGVHYDRGLFRDGSVRRLLETIDRCDARAVTYLRDGMIHVPDRHGVVVWTVPYDDGVFEVRTSEIVRLTVAGTIYDMGSTWPYFSNTAVHRDVLDAIRTWFGSYCSSLGPDATFAYRFCVVERTSIHLDAPLAFLRAPRRSNGIGYHTGEKTDFDDLMRRIGDRPWLDAAPIPGLNLGQNMLFHDYELVRREAPDLPPISRAGYLSNLAAGLAVVSDPARRAEFAEVLREHGWTGEDDGANVLRVQRGGPLRRRLRRFAGRSSGRVDLLKTLVTRKKGVNPRAFTGRYFRFEWEAVWWLRHRVRTPGSELPPDPATGRALLDHRLP